MRRYPRYLTDTLAEMLGRKIILLSGPRQVGKTTLAKSLAEKFAYYNYDIIEHRKIILKRDWDTAAPVLIFDEIHKMKNWKLWLKGLYDDDILKRQAVIVTGSARLDVAKKMGDSLAGRFFGFKLYPLDLKELESIQPGSYEKNYYDLITVSGFPEPFSEKSKRFYGMWKKGHSDLILKQDLISIENVRDIESLELLLELISERVGSIVSIKSLAEDLNKDEKTIKRWLTVLENMFLIFKLTPDSKNIARGITKASKYYLYDSAAVLGDESQKLENLVALSLQKEIDFQNDCFGEKLKLHFLRTRDGKEIDFAVKNGRLITHLIEVKLSDNTVSHSFKTIGKHCLNAKKIQVLKNVEREYLSKLGVSVQEVTKFLKEISLV